MFFSGGEEVCGAVCVDVRVYMLMCVEAVHYLDMHEHTMYTVHVCTQYTSWLLFEHNRLSY